MYLAIPEGLANANPMQWACGILLVCIGIGFVMANRSGRGPK
jgi:hypothetical protein